MSNHARPPGTDQPIPGRRRLRDRVLLALAVVCGVTFSLFTGLVALALVVGPSHPAPASHAPVPVVATTVPTFQVPTFQVPVASPPPTSTPPTSSPVLSVPLASPPPTPTTTVQVAAVPTSQAQIAVPPPATAAGPRTTTVFACGGDSYVNSDGNCVPRPTQAAGAPPNATAQCRDGSYSFSQHRQGTCSGHGGVARWL